MYFKYNKLITVVAPSEEVKNGLEKFMEFEGVMSSCYKIMISSMLTLKNGMVLLLKPSILSF